MRAITFLILSFQIAFLSSANSQELQLVWGQQYVYNGMENPLEFYVDGVSCKSIQFTSSGGTIKKHDACRLIVTPGNVDTMRIHAFYEIRGKRVELKPVHLIVHSVTKANAYLGHKLGGKISKAFVLAVGGLSTKLQTRFDHDDPITAESYQIVLIRNNESKLVTNQGNRFEAAAIELLNQAEKGDVIVFCNIRARLRDRILLANPMQFELE